MTIGVFPSPVAGVSGTTLISNTVANGFSSLSLSSIPGTYKDLLLTWSGINHSAANTNFNLRLNNDSGTNYDVAAIRRFGTSMDDEIASSDRLISNSYAPFGNDVNLSTSHLMCKGYIYIENYASSSLWKSITGQWTFKPNQFSQTSVLSLNTTYKSTSPITSINIVRTEGSATFSNNGNTSIRLYGIS